MSNARRVDLDTREIATVIAALREYQARVYPTSGCARPEGHGAGCQCDQGMAAYTPGPADWDDIASDGGTLVPLDPDEIDLLIHDLNRDSA